MACWSSCPPLPMSPLCSDVFLCVTMAFVSNQKMTPVMTNRGECCVGSGCRVAGLAAPPFEARGVDSVSWITGVVSWLLRGVCETPRNSAWAHTHTHSLRKSVELHYVTMTITSLYSGRKKWKKKNLQRGVLGQHRQVFSVLEFYSLQGVLWGFVTLQTVYMQKKLHNTQGDGY